MSTRANIVIKDEYRKLYFYRHSDGYPEGVMPTLQKFLDFVKEGKIRDNVGQAAGWLIVFGAVEYDVNNDISDPDTYYKPFNTPISEYLPTKEGYSGWKVGAYEPTDDIHGDIEFLYIVDLKKKTIETVTKDFDVYANKKIYGT